MNSAAFSAIISVAHACGSDEVERRRPVTACEIQQLVIALNLPMRNLPPPE
jgi:hypothetical protein